MTLFSIDLSKEQVPHRVENQPVEDSVEGVNKDI
jgi:hypothetical protein